MDRFDSNESDAPDLIEIFAEQFKFNRPLIGVDFHRKLSGNLPRLFYLTLILLYIDIAISTVLTFLPTEGNGDLLLLWGDFSYHLLSENRNFMVGTIYVTRFSMVVMMTLVAFADFTWLSEAAQLFEQVKNATLCGKMRRIGNRCRKIGIVAGVMLTFLPTGAHINTTFLYPERNRPHDLRLAHTYLVSYDLFYPVFNVQFMMQMHFMCRCCFEIFADVNARFKAKLASCNRYDRFALFLSYYKQFSVCCLLVHHILRYISWIYITFFICNMTVVIFTLYSGIYLNSSLLQQTIFVTYVIFQLSFIVFSSHTIGKIDVCAKKMGDLVYQTFIIGEDGDRKAYLDRYNWQFLRYFNSVWSSTISLELMGSPINSSTSIMILTVLLTLFAFFI